MSDNHSQSVTEYHIDTPAGVRAIIPQLLGFTPENSVVVIGTEPPDGKVVVTMRYDLPDPAGAGVSADIAEHAENALLGAGVSTAIVAGYGPDELTGPVTEALSHMAMSVRVIDNSPEDTLPELAPVSPARNPVLPDRAALAASVAPVTGAWRENMRQLTRRELQRADEMPRRAVEVGLAGIQHLIDRYREGDAIVTDTEAATVTVAMRHLRVRDDAWSRMVPAHKKAHLRLLTGLTRLAAPGYVAAPAALLAFVAWQNGDGALANVALDRALADDPRYSMALLLRQVITSGAPPSMARLPMSPAEVSASYDEQEAEEQHTS